MRIESFDTEQRVLIVAAIGNNHEGNFDVAQELVCRAAEAGADAVKFQTIRSEHLVSPGDRARFDQLRRFELSCEQFQRLAELARQAGVLFLSTPFDLRSATFLGRIAPAIRICSGDNTFIPLLEAAARTARPLIVSTGLTTVDTVRQSLEAVRRTWRDAGVSQELALLHCVSSYPTPIEQTNLGAIRHLQEYFGCTVGFSDHTIGIEAAMLAVVAGARIIEKHFTLDKNFSDLPDHKISADATDLADLVARIRYIEEVLGRDGKVIQPCEQKAIVGSRRSIAAARNLTAGTRLTLKDITWLRPGGGFPPGDEDQVIGRTLRFDAPQGHILTPEILEPADQPTESPQTQSAPSSRAG